MSHEFGRDRFVKELLFFCCLQGVCPGFFFTHEGVELRRLRHFGQGGQSFIGLFVVVVGAGQADKVGRIGSGVGMVTGLLEFG